MAGYVTALRLPGTTALSDRYEIDSGTSWVAYADPINLLIWFFYKLFRIVLIWLLFYEVAALLF